MKKFFMVYVTHDNSISDKQEWTDYSTENENFEEEINEHYDSVYEIVEVSEFLQEDFLLALHKSAMLDLVKAQVGEMFTICDNIICADDLGDF
jgi:hypothetical protein